MKLDKSTAQVMNLMHDSVNAFNLAQLRHAWQHIDQGRIAAGKEVLASVIRSMERNPH
jgi:hypothetical protein